MYISTNARRLLWLAAIAAALAAVYLVSDREWHCGAVVTKHSAGQIRSPGKASHVGPFTIDVQQHGTIVTGGTGKRKSDEASGSFSTIDLPGKRNYHFDFSGGVSRLRVRSDSTVIYDGPPVARPAAKVTGRLGIDFDWREESGSVTVFDRCSIRSHWDWLVKQIAG